MFALRRIAVLLVPPFCVPPLAAQDATDLALRAPDAVFAEPFSLVRGARELRDGRLLITDWIEERLVVVDYARGTATDHGRTGAGPGEFRLPAALLPFRGDSTLLVDVGNARLHVVDGAGRIGRAFQPPVPAAAAPFGADRSGRLHYAVPAWQRRPPLPGDTVEIASWHPDDAAPRTTARMHGSTRPPGNSSLGPRMPFVAFAPQDGVAVGPDGRIALVRGADYRVEWLAGGRRTAGPAYAERTERAGPAERTAFARRFLRAAPMSGRGEGGGLGHTPADAQTDAAVAELVRHSTFAETLPHFRPSELRIDGAGRLWVARWMPLGQSEVYDVFDAVGVRTASLRLPAGRRLVAIGAAAVHLVHEDAMGLQTLERYPLPAPLTTP